MPRLGQSSPAPTVTPPLLPTLDRPPDKPHSCNVCGDRFSRAEHLRRHRTRHSGEKNYRCDFCLKDFSRKYDTEAQINLIRDLLKPHVPAIGSSSTIGHAHSVGRVSSLACNLEVVGHMLVLFVHPRSFVATANILAAGVSRSTFNVSTAHSLEMKARVTGASWLFTGADSFSGKRSGIPDPNQQRVAIRALLNEGRSSFVKTFDLPPSDVHSSNTQSPRAGGGQIAPGSSFNWTDIALDVFSASYDEFRNPLWTDPFGDAAAENFSYSYIQPNLNTDSHFGSGPLQPSPEDEDGRRLMRAIEQKLHQVRFSEAQDLLRSLQVLFTGSNIGTHLSRYFECWHTSCPIIHEASFDRSTAPTRLLLSMCLLGAAYSKDEIETTAARSLLDVSELIVFDAELFSLTSEIRNSMWQDDEKSADIIIPEDPCDLHELQAAYLIVEAQYWAGTRRSRRRVIESRYSELLRISRRMGLIRVRHSPADRVSESAWLQKESRIRTAAFILLLDTAMGIYSNFPSRTSQTELHFDIPCQERTFCSSHPFVEDDLVFTTRKTWHETYSSLFNNSSVQQLASRLTILHLFMLIHFLYIDLVACIKANFSCGTGSTPRVDKSLGSSAALSSLQKSKDWSWALKKWHQIWEIVCLETRRQGLRYAAIFKKAHYFWMMAQALIERPGAIDVVVRMEVNCDDALLPLKAIFEDESNTHAVG